MSLKKYVRAQLCETLEIIKSGFLFAFRFIFRPRIITINGIKLKVKHPAISQRMKLALYTNLYELDERIILHKTLDKNDRVLEAGAGVGMMGMLSSTLLADDSQLVIYEANPNLLSLIKENMALNGKKLNIVNKAVSNQNGTLTFYISENFLSSSAIEKKETRPVEVPTESLSSIIQNFKPTYLLMDIEGAEAEILGKTSLDSVRKICIEVHPHYAGEKPISEMLAALFAQGFSIDFYISRCNTLYLYR